MPPGIIRSGRGVLGGFCVNDFAVKFGPERRLTHPAAWVNVSPVLAPRYPCRSCHPCLKNRYITPLLQTPGLGHVRAFPDMSPQRRLPAAPPIFANPGSMSSLSATIRITPTIIRLCRTGRAAPDSKERLTLFGKPLKLLDGRTGQVMNDSSPIG